ncbi:hypothetical protein SAMN03159343_0209 [Klenkia marina]|uniref:Uncharacterized protein n=1 Tax=Klenkia marina TaxID=1960309 RepID=A0A1G4X9K3_9ACTN|nr:hypothetical protein [Klenkia marina]SCX37812.1 hypothetical protein SAMN03159343_0209 [Klenkia marina]
MKQSRLTAFATFAVVLLAGCGNESELSTTSAVGATRAATWVGPSGLELESEADARSVLVAQRAEAERAEAERVAAELAAVEAAAQQAAEDAASQQAAEEAAAQAVIDAEGGCPPGWYFDDALGCTRSETVADEDDGYVYSDLEVRCSDGTATVEECFGPGSDLNGNGVADVNE